MDIVEMIGKRILHLCKEKNMSINKLSKRSGVSNTAINGILNQSTNNPRILTIKRICDGFDITIKEFFDVKEFKKYM